MVYVIDKTEIEFPDMGDCRWFFNRKRALSRSAINS